MSTPSTPSEPQGGSPETPSIEEVQEMMPTVLELQRLISSRMSRSVRRPGGDDFGVISCTSCNSQSCG